MPRFFIENLPDGEDGVIRLTGDDAHHVRDVLRAKPDGRICVCDSAGAAADFRVASFTDAGDVALSVESRTAADTEPPFEVTLYQGLAKGAGVDLCLLPWEIEQKQTVRDILKSWPEPVEGCAATLTDIPAAATAKLAAQPAGNGRPITISVIIGPEGGFDPEEAERAIRAGFRPVSLGRRILRTETAGAAVLSMLIYRFEKF